MYKSDNYFAGEERVDFFLALCRQTSGQVIEVISFFNDRRPVEVVRQPNCAQQVTVFANQAIINTNKNKKITSVQWIWYPLYRARGRVNLLELSLDRRMEVSECSVSVGVYDAWVDVLFVVVCVSFALVKQPVF